VHPRDEHDHLADCPEIDQENWTDDWTSRKRAGAAFFVAGKHIRLCDFSASRKRRCYSMHRYIYISVKKIYIRIYIYIFFY